jgi:hypothetical protein
VQNRIESRKAWAKTRPISKITGTPRAEGIAHVVTHLLSMGKALSSNLSTTEEKGEKKGEDRGETFTYTAGQSDLLV